MRVLLPITSVEEPLLREAMTLLGNVESTCFAAEVLAAEVRAAEVRAMWAVEVRGKLLRMAAPA